MEYIYIGKIVGTHGIKGELKIISDFKYKNEAFKLNNTIYIGKTFQEFTINSYRKHKIYDMITLKDKNDINDVLIYKNKNVYINKLAIKVEYFDEDLINMEVYSNDKLIGIVKEIYKGIKYDFLKLNNDTLIPNIKEFVNKIDTINKKIYINEIEGLINEN